MQRWVAYAVDYDCSCLYETMHAAESYSADGA